MLATTIELNKLDVSERNVRKNKTDVAGLAESIEKNGLLQNLVVIPSGEKFEVVAGERRLTALRLLAKKKKIAADFPVPVLVADEGNASVLSLTENFQRVQMNVIDEAEAFTGCVEAGISIADICKKFAVGKVYVRQRMKLAGLADAIKQAAREERLTMDALQAYALEPDPKRQEAIFNELGDDEDAETIRDEIIGGTVASTHPLAAFVGAARYVKAGGRVTRDLFSDAEYFDDAALLDRVALEALEEVPVPEGFAWKTVQLRRDYSWNWMTSAPGESPEKERIDGELSALDDRWAARDIEWAEYRKEKMRLEGELAASRVVPDEWKARSGVVVWLEEGRPQMIIGLVRKEDMPGEEEDIEEDEDVDEASYDDESDEESVEHVEEDSEPGFVIQEEEDLPAVFSKDVAADLHVIRTAEVRYRLASRFDVAFDVMLASMIEEGRHSSNALFDLSMRPVTIETTQKSIRGSELEAAHKAIRERALSEVMEGRKQKTSLFEHLQGVDMVKKQALFAALASFYVPSTVASSTYKAVESRVGANARDHWRPSAGNLFSRVTKNHLLSWGATLISHEWWTKAQKQRKGELVDALEKAMVDDETDAVSRWLPW